MKWENKMSKPRYKWQSLKRATTLKPPSEELIRVTMEGYDIDREAAIKIILDYEMQVEIWINDIYQVQKRIIQGNLIHLNIRRRDGGPIMRDWRHFQQIKNELIGEECEAVELYPAESRKVDTSNKFHLWGVKDPTFRFPIGMDVRDVHYHDSKDPGLRQRPE
jgi:hypothetical protein